jgi:hypothetical protein
MFSHEHRLTRAHLTKASSRLGTASARALLPLFPAADARRVCQAWHRTSEVQVLAPGMRGAEGEEKGKGIHRELGSGGSPIHTRGATNRNRIRGVVHPGRAGT